MSGDRQQRRQRRRQLLQEGETALKRGLPLVPRKDTLVGVTLLLKDILIDVKRADRASAAAEATLRVLDTSIKAEPGHLELACRKGCSYCCHAFVTATAPEMFLIARYLQSRKAAAAEMTREAILTRAAVTAGFGITERIGRKLACPLLGSDGACSIYAIRPAVCRQTTSVDLAACIEEYEGRDAGGDIRVSRVYLDHARNGRIPLQAALIASGLPPQSYELSAGLRAAMEPGAEAAWLSGADVFRDVAQAPAEPAPLAQAIHKIAAEAAAF